MSSAVVRCFRRRTQYTTRELEVEGVEGVEEQGGIAIKIRAFVRTSIES